MNGRRSRVRSSLAPLALLLLLAAEVPAQEERFQIVSGDTKQVVFRERVPEQVALDPGSRAFHHRGCPALAPAMEWVAPGAATLRGFRAHCPELRKPEYATRTEARVPRDPKRHALLFLGNSLTYYNQMPAMVEAIARREERSLLVDSVTRSGATLDQLWNETTALRDLWLRHWDYVVLQGGAGSTHPLLRGEEFDRELGRFAAEIRRAGAEPLFYLVWRPRVPPAAFETASLAAARRAGMRVIPAGSAWSDLLRSGRFPRLDQDGLHPDAFGSYLIACSVFSTIYGKPAHGAPFNFRHLAVSGEVSDAALRNQRLTAEDARALQDAAWEAVRGSRAP